MSSPDSIPAAVVIPVAPRLTVVPRPESARSALRAGFAELPPAVVGGAGAVLILTVWVFSSKLLAVDLSSMIIDTTASARLIGSLSFLTVVLIAVAIAVLHRALRVIPAAERIARQVAMIALAGAYLHLILWFSRFIAAAMTSAVSGSLATFMPNMFWWG